MSWLAQSKSTPKPADKDVQDEICPICKSSRYLTPSLRFLINPECYHKMCESCVDRIFSHGPASCPIPGCPKTLRKAKFRTPTFSDLQVEREVDIRRRVAAVFNRREEDFEDLRSYNDYLNEVEDITFNLIYKIDLDETEKRFESYERAHKQEIMENASLEERQRAEFREGLKSERDAARQRREAARREDAEEKKELEANRQDVLNRLASGQDAERVTQEGAKVQLKKRMDRAAAAERQRQLQAASTNGATFKGLKSRQKAEPEEPIDPFGGLSYEGRKYYSLQDDYVWAGVQESKADVLIGAGGYDVSAFTSRALCEAFAGLGVFVGEEMGERDRRQTDLDVVATDGAAVAAKRAPGAAMGKAKEVKMDDPF